MVRGLVDEAEEAIVRGVITRGVDDATGSDLRSLPVFVCIEDLEDELIRAVGASAVEAMLDREGDLGSFRTLQKQPAWRDGGMTAQLRRFLGAGARRKLRYARLVCLELDSGQIPRPLGLIRRSCSWPHCSSPCASNHGFVDKRRVSDPNPPA